MVKKILKFGGTSVGTIERIQHVANIIQKEHSAGNQVIAVVSAMSGQTNDLITLSKKISTEVFDQIKQHAEYTYNKHNSIQDEDEDDDIPENGGEAFETYIKILKVAGKLKQTSFKNNIMSECQELFYDTDKTFYERLDSNTNLIGFNNWVYDLLGG